MIWGRGVAKNIIDFALFFFGRGGPGSLSEVEAVMSGLLAMPARSATQDGPSRPCSREKQGKNDLTGFKFARQIRTQRCHTVISLLQES